MEAASSKIRFSARQRWGAARAGRQEPAELICADSSGGNLSNDERGDPKNPKIFWGEMKDFIQRGSGDSRYLKTSLPPETSWPEALALLRQGKFPMDLAGMNPAGWLQMGTLLSKANLLRDETAQLLGLTPDAVPDDAFRAAAQLLAQQADKLEQTAAEIKKAAPSDFQNLVAGRLF